MAELQRRGYGVGEKRVQRLMKLMGIEAMYPKPKTTIAAPEHKKYSYLLRGLDIVRPNQVWEMDITYIPNLHRAVLAQHKIRGHLSERLRGRSGVVARNRQLHQHLQHKKAAPKS